MMRTGKRILKKIIKFSPKALGIVLSFSIFLIELYPIFGFSQKNYVYADYKPGWGVLAFNSNKSSYRVGETANFSFAVLDDYGGMVCSAKLEFIVRNRLMGVEEVFSTENGRIKVNKDCKVKDYTDIPDFEAELMLEKWGYYELELTAEITAGRYTIKDGIWVNNIKSFDVERSAPTRIFPPETYPVTVKITPLRDFKGKVEDIVPKSFEIEGEGFEIFEIDKSSKKIVWDVDWESGKQHTLTYNFTAPQKSPEYYVFGKLKIIGEKSILLKEKTHYEEGRHWQVASDAANDVFIFWDDSLGGSVPSGWTSESDGGETYENTFIRGAATAGGTGGTANHNHTPAISNVQTVGTPLRKKGTVATTGVGSHTHSSTSITSVVGSNLPDYSTLMVIKSSGTPTQIPRYGIALFDADPGASWTRYSTQDGKYIYGGSTAGTTGGNSSNAHTHNTTSITLNAPGGATVKEGVGGFYLVSDDTHTHTSSDVTSTSATTEPPYINTLLYYPTSADIDLQTGIIGMFDATPLPTNWDSVSGASDPFENNFIKPASSYGSTGGTSSAHTHAGTAGGTSDSATGSDDDDGAVANGAVELTHTHTFDVSLTTLGGETYVPPYIDMVIGKYTAPPSTAYTQDDFEFFVTANDVNLTNIWPPGTGENIVENGVLLQIPATNDALEVNDKIRIQMNFKISGATLAANTEDFQLEYDEASNCTTATGWADVAGVGETGAPWRLFGEAGLNDTETQVNDITSSTASAEGNYSEIIPSGTNPNEVLVTENSEWDWPVENYSATNNTSYCFRMVVEDGGSGTPFGTYETDGYPNVYTIPTTANQMRHGAIFSEETERGFYW